MESNFIYHNAFWPKVMTCGNCGKTARPRHIDLEPPNPDKVFCPFCFEEVPLETYKKDENDLGEWTDVGSLSCRCSKCGCKNNRQTPYCPICGKKMRNTLIFNASQ